VNSPHIVGPTIRFRHTDVQKEKELIIYLKKRYPLVQSFKKLKSYAGGATQKKERKKGYQTIRDSSHLGTTGFAGAKNFEPIDPSPKTPRTPVKPRESRSGNESKRLIMDCIPAAKAAPSCRRRRIRAEVQV
jgi:hypothetical protein